MVAGKCRQNLEGETSNMKYQLLTNDSIQFQHPKKKLPIKLYRIYCLKDFDVNIKGFKATVKSGTVGGYVQAETNLPQNDSSWVFHTAKVFDNVRLSDSVVRDEAWVFESSELSGSVVCKKSHIWGECSLKDSWVDDNVDVHGACVLTNSEIRNSSVVCGRSIVKNSKLFNGSRIYNSQVKDTKMFDVSEIKEGSVVENCILKGRTVISNKIVKNESRQEDIALNVMTGND